VCAWLSMTGPLVWAQGVPTTTVEERAITGAKEYIKQYTLKNPSLTMLMMPFFRQAMPTFTKQWEELTGVKVKLVEQSAMDIPARIMAEAAAKTGEYDLLNAFPGVVPDAVSAGAILPMDEYAAKGQPDFSPLEAPLQAQQTYNGKLYFLLLDGEHLMLVLRRDVLDLPGAREEFRAKYGWEPGCPETLGQWEQLAEFFHTKRGQTRWGKTFDQDLYGALGSRSLHTAHRHFSAYFGGVWFDKEMKPRIQTPHGIQAIKHFISIARYMPPDVPTWGTPQIVPFWASGQAFSVMAAPSIVSYSQNNAESKIKGQQLSCLMPGTVIDGKLMRRSPQATGAGYMVSRSSKHPELAYYFLQWLTGPTKGEDVIAHPQGTWEPVRRSSASHEAILGKFGAQFVEVTVENTKYATALLMLPGNTEYFSVLDTQLALVMQGQASAEDAAKNIEEGWNKITDNVGRQEQIRLWRSSVESGAYLDKW